MGYKFIGKSVWIPEEGALIITDLHIGYEEGLEIAMPRSQYKEMIEDFDKIFEEINKIENKNRDSNKINNNSKNNTRNLIINNKEDRVINNLKSAEAIIINNKDVKKENNKIKEIIILGDLKHKLGEFSGQEWKETREFLRYLKEKTGKIILIKGNHDNFLAGIAVEEVVEIKDYYISGDIAFIHGDKKILEIEDKKIKTIFLGHFHPAIRLESGAKSEIYKCFLKGEWKEKEVIILPSFFPLVEGVDVSKEDTNLAYNFKLENFKVFIPAPDEALGFGKVKDVRRLIG